MEKKVNICMVTFNRLDFTKESIKSIIDRTAGYPFVLTVIDNDSIDGTQDFLKRVYKDGKIKNLILLKENVGVAKASNIGWQLENTKYYMKIDNDIVININNWLAPMIEVIDKVDRIGMLGYSCEAHNAQPQNVDGHPLILKDKNLGGACVLIPERTKQRLGCWCEDYGKYSEEDLDYGRRIEMIGKKNFYMPNLNAITHLNSKEEYIEYFRWKVAIRREGVEKVLKKTKYYSKNPDKLYIEPSINIKDIKDQIYLGE